MTIHCYQCGTRSEVLSPRSRCANCEHDRAEFNAAENDQLRNELASVAAERDALAAQLDEAREQHAATLNRLYEIFSIDASDGEVRAKWALLEASIVVDNNKALTSQVEAMKKGIHHFNRTRGDLNPLFEAAFKTTPSACLAQVRAEAGRAGYVAGCELIIDLVSDGANTGAYKFHADEYAKRILKGGK